LVGDSTIINFIKKEICNLKFLIFKQDLIFNVLKFKYLKIV